MALAVLVRLFSVAIPILSIRLAGDEERLKFRAKKQELGVPTQPDFMLNV